MRTRGIPAKVGTQPMNIVLQAHQRIKLNKPLIFREAKPYTKWQTGIVTKVNEQGMPFIDLM